MTEQPHISVQGYDESYETFRHRAFAEGMRHAAQIVETHRIAWREASGPAQGFYSCDLPYRDETAKVLREAANAISLEPKK